ncbi:MAG: hypothetical protein COA62_15970 [Rhodobiaceae bacterium]|nr:MAG: hypothetical protein COA62_15970 [Rhodobiaceae bacterium]
MKRDRVIKRARISRGRRRKEFARFHEEIRAAWCDIMDGREIQTETLTGAQKYALVYWWIGKEP